MTAVDVADGEAGRILALVDQARLADVVRLGEQLIADQPGFLRGVGYVLARGGAYADVYARLGGRDPTGFRRRELRGLLVDQARRPAHCEALARELELSGDGLWEVVGAALRVVLAALRTEHERSRR